MNKKLLRVALLVAVVAVAGLGAHKAQAKKPVLSDIMLANVETFTEPEYDYAVVKCVKLDECTNPEKEGYCISVSVNGTHGVKCDYSVNHEPDCCGVKMDYGNVGV